MPEWAVSAPPSFAKASRRRRSANPGGNRISEGLTDRPLNALISQLQNAGRPARFRLSRRTSASAQDHRHLNLADVSQHTHGHMRAGPLQLDVDHGAVHRELTQRELVE